MMKALVLSTVSLLLMSASPAFAVLIDFEAQSGFYNADTPSSEFAGLVFDRDLQVLPGTLVAAGPGQSGQVARAATPPFGSNPRGGDIGGLFDGFTVSALSLVVGDSGNDLDIFQLLGYDKLGNLIADSGQLSSISAITIAIMQNGIASFLLRIADLPNNEGSSSIDNIEFAIEKADVPEPGTLLLLTFAFTILALKARRRKL